MYQEKYFYSNPKKSKVVTLRDVISFSELKCAVYELRDSARKNQTIVECLHECYPFGNDYGGEEVVIRNEYRDTKAWKEALDDWENDLSSFIRKLKEEQIGILEFIDKYHDFIDTDIPHVKNKEIGLKKILQWYNESIQDLISFCDIVQIFKEACSLHITKKSKLNRFESNFFENKKDGGWFK